MVPSDGFGASTRPSAGDGWPRDAAAPPKSDAPSSVAAAEDAAALGGREAVLAGSGAGFPEDDVAAADWPKAGADGRLAAYPNLYCPSP